MRVTIAQLNPLIGDFAYNSKKICDAIKQAKTHEADLVLFPEMALCGYPPEDLLLMPSFIVALEKALGSIIPVTKGITAIVGCVRKNEGAGEKRLFNSAAILQDGELIGFQDKVLLPDYDVFSERRYFEPGSSLKLWEIVGCKVGLTICEDIWQHAGSIGYSNYPRDPIQELFQLGPQLLLNLSASPYYMQRQDIRLNVCKKAAKTLHCPVVLCNQVGGNDSLIFDGGSLFLNREGELIQKGTAFQEATFTVDTQVDRSTQQFKSDPLEEMYQALVLGVRDYFHKLGFKKACLGLSGGIDSAVVAAIATEALGCENVLVVLLPSRYTSKSSYQDAYALSEKLNLHAEEISIENSFTAVLDTLSVHFKDHKSDATEENIQARIRGLLLMAFCNKHGYLLLSTANKSEMAMGYSTLYGDMCGALAVLSDVTKGQVYQLAYYINRNKEIIPQSILTKPPSAELRFDQKDSDSLPEYPVVDSVLMDYVEEHLSIEEIASKHALPLELVRDLVRRIHLNEYKRRQSPPGLRVTKKAFTIGRKFPIVQHWNM